MLCASALVLQMLNCMYRRFCKLLLSAGEAWHAKKALSVPIGNASRCGCNAQIIQTLVTDIEPDSKVRVAMNEINAAVRQRAAALEKAEAGVQPPT